MPDRAFFRLLDVLEQERDVAPERFFDLMRESFRISGLLYLRADIDGAVFRISRLAHTFDRETATRLTSDGTVRSTPFISAIAGGAIRPLDWKTIRDANPQGAASVWTTYGDEKQGVTLPLAASGTSIALLALESSLDASDWPSYSRAHLRDFQYLANLFHAGRLEKESGPTRHPPHVRLTGRETEVLGWAAAGKSYWEIAVILGISERTVRFFMTNARRKLNVVSNAQAVATAVKHDLLRIV